MGHVRQILDFEQVTALRLRISFNLESEMCPSLLCHMVYLSVEDTDLHDSVTMLYALLTFLLRTGALASLR